jgi:hypothetical protein
MRGLADRTDGTDGYVGAQRVDRLVHEGFQDARQRRHAGVPRGLTAAVLLAFAGCGGPGTPAPRAPESLPTSLLLVRISPAPGTTVMRDSVVTAVLRYSVRGFRRGAFAVVTQVATVDAAGATNASHAPTANPVLLLPSGTLTLRFPLATAWDDSDVARPLRLWFALTRIGLPSGSRVLAKTAVVEWPAR